MQCVPVRVRALAAAALLAIASFATAGSSLPGFPADGVAVSDVDDTFDGLRTYLRGHKSQAGATYHACFVKFSDPRNRSGRQHSGSAVKFVDTLFAKWKPQLDPSNHVIILVSTENRGIAIHPGSRWTGLGFEQRAMTRVIDNSPFAQYARSGDLAAGVERLIGAIDLHLGLLLQQQVERGKRIVESVGTVRGQIDGLRQTLRGQPFDTGRAQEPLERAATLVAAADEALRSDDVERASDLVQVASAAVNEAQRAHTRAATRHAQLERLRAAAPREMRDARAEFDELGARIAGASYAPQRFRNTHQEIGETLAEGDRGLEQNDPVLAVARARSASKWISQLSQSLDREAASHHFKTRTAPAIAAAIAGFIALIVLLILRLTRSARRRSAESIVRRWHRTLDKASSRVLALRNEHPTLFGTGQLEQRYVGETATALHDVGEIADDYLLSYAAADTQLARAEAQIAEGGALAWAAYDRAIAMLEKDAVEIRREHVGGESLLLAETRPVTRKADELIEFVEEAYAEVFARVSGLQGRIRATPEQMSKALEEITAMEPGLAVLDGRGVDVTVYRSALAKLVTRHGELAGTAHRDPLGVCEPVVELLTAAETLAQRTGRVAAARNLLDEAIDRVLLDTLERIRTLRLTDGAKIAEPGFEPEAMAAAAEELAATAMAEAADGSDEDALRRAGDAESTVREIGRLVAATLASREKTPGVLDEREVNQRNLRTRLPERRLRIDGLRESHDDDALQPALDNAEEAEEALDFVTRCIAEARTALGRTEQRYLAAAELARRAGVVVADVDELYDEIESKSDELDAARAAAESALATAGATLDGIAEALATEERFPSKETLEAATELASRRVELTELCNADRPHWPRCRDATALLRRLADETRDRARDERAAYRRAEALRESVLDDLAEVRHLLDVSEDDRPRANARCADATPLAEQVRNLRHQKHPDWADVEARLNEIATITAEAKDLARADLQAAAAARKAIAKADDAIDGADKPYGYGIRARLNPAKKALRRARKELGSQDYERSLRQAQKAEDGAAEARRAATGKARRRAAAEAAEMAVTLLATVAASGFRAASRRSRSSSRRSSSSSSSSFGSFGSSFGSSIGSSRSSFGGGSSGGSSFGSSSGGSSFGSSSGGSSW